MTAQLLIEILSDLPPDTIIAFSEGGVLVSPCAASSGMIEAEVDDSEVNDSEVEKVFFLSPCHCHDEDALEDIEVHVPIEIDEIYLN